MKRILITGKNSYVGNKFAEWLEQWPNDYTIDKVSLRSDNWLEQDWSRFDSILHVAGIAHNSSDKSLESLYYEVNRDLSVQVAMKAKAEGVNHFVYMSSIIVFGTKQAVITKDTLPDPDNFYGDSKLQAEKQLELLQAANFKIAFVRPPMIYGKDSKGNFPRLSKLAKATPIFPEYDNKRSMLHVDNLSEFLRLIIDNNDQGYYHPQNKEYVNTSELVSEIAKNANHKLITTKLFNPFIKLVDQVGVVNKVFGDLYYQQDMNKYHTDYNVHSFKDTIKVTELTN